MSTRPCPKQGFTLLELLVVVAVIGLLLAILLPALSAASEAGRSAICGANLNQLGQGALAYSQENDHLLPWYPVASRRPEGSQWWVTQVARGMDQFEPKIYTCPSDPLPYEIPIYYYNGIAYMNDGRLYGSEGSNPLANAANDRPLVAEHAGGRTMWLKVTYRGSCSLMIGIQGADKAWADHVRRVTEFTQPDKVVQLVEGVQVNQYGKNGYTLQECMSQAAFKGIIAGRTDYDSWRRHFGTTNVCFLDGHVERLPPMQVAEVGVRWRSFLPPRLQRVDYIGNRD